MFEVLPLQRHNEIQGFACRRHKVSFLAIIRTKVENEVTPAGQRNIFIISIVGWLNGKATRRMCLLLHWPPSLFSARVKLNVKENVVSH